jgi:DNA-binding CsgD family transcriptional regulator
MIEDQEYNLFFKFLETFSPVGFKGIDPEHPLMLGLERMMEKNNQFFYIGDAIQLKILYTSQRSTQMIGIHPDDLNLYHFMEITHQTDIQRLSTGRSKVIKMAQDIFIAGRGEALLSTNFRIRNAGGSYSNFLMQNYLYYTSIPYKTVFSLKIHTNIDWCRKIKSGYHYYIGNDLAYFRYPNQEMLDMGNILSAREFEIIKLVEQGLSTEQIAEKLFISPYTVNTHRGNILQKCGKPHISDVIYYLQERGII